MICLQLHETKRTSLAPLQDAQFWNVKVTWSADLKCAAELDLRHDYKLYGKAIQGQFAILWSFIARKALEQYTNCSHSWHPEQSQAMPVITPGNTRKQCHSIDPRTSGLNNKVLNLVKNPQQLVYPQLRTTPSMLHMHKNSTPLCDRLLSKRLNSFPKAVHWSCTIWESCGCLLSTSKAILD